MKNIVAVALVFSLMVLPVSVGAEGLPAARTVLNTSSSLKDKEKAAAQLLPAGSVLMHSDNSNGEITLNYFGLIEKELYTLVLSSSTGALLKADSQINMQEASAKALLSTGTAIKEAAAHKLVTDEIKGAVIVGTGLEFNKDKVQQYVIRFKTATHYGIYIINAKSGLVLERRIKAGTPPDFDGDNYNISINRLSIIAFDTVQGGVMTDMGVKSIDDTVVYSAEVFKNDTQHSLLVDAKTGDLISDTTRIIGWNDNNYSLTWQYKGFIPFNQVPARLSPSIMSTAKAVERAKTQAPSAVLTEIKLYYNGDKAIYEGTLSDDKLEYFFKIDAVSSDKLYWDTSIIKNN